MRPHQLLTTALTLTSLATLTLSAPVSNPSPAPAPLPTNTPPTSTHHDLLAEIDKVALILQVPPAHLHTLFKIYPPTEPQSPSNSEGKKASSAVFLSDDSEAELEDKSACSGLLKFVCKLFGKGKSSKPAPNQGMQLGPLRPDQAPGMGNSVSVSGGR